MAQDMAVTTTTDKNPLQLNNEDASFQSLDNDPPELRNIPPIRDNPEMAETTSKRRSSVAHPQSIQYRNPTHDSSSNENNSTTDDEDGDDEQDSEYDDDNDDVFSATNENINDDDDPSISDLNEINNDINKIMNRPPISQNYQPINQRDDNDNHNDNDDEIDPFARLGQKQESIALPPLINALAQQQQVQQQIIVNKLNRLKQFDNRNPYSPDAILDPKHLQRHSRAGSKHSRSQTLANSGYMRGNNTQMIQQRQRNNKRRHQHKSSSVDWSGGMNGPPSGPDLTFVCMRIENRTILQNSLSDTEFMQLMQIHNAIMLDGLKHFNGHCIEQFNGHVYDVLTVFNDVYDAIRCAINIQKELNNYKWPIFYYKLEKESNQMQYVGKSRNKNAFNGIRVGMGLHTATVGTNKNKYDGGKETCHVETIIFDATYKGTAVELVKALCIKSYGGELLATKAVSQALLRSKKGGDEISLQGLGTCSIHKIRSVELIELIPRDLPHRMFPPRSLMTHATNHLTQESNLLLVDEQSETPSYDPFPNPKPNPKPNNNNDDNYDEEYDTTKENDSDDSSHSSKDGIQHNPNISSYNRRPSITQIGPVGPDTQIEVSFTGGDDEYDIYDDNNNDNDSNNNSNNEYKQSYDNNLLGIDHYKKKQIVEKGMDTSSDHSLGPPKKHQTRVKAHEIEKRKSGIHIMNMMQFQQNNDKMNMKSKKKDIKKKKNKRKHKYDGDDERSPLPDERDYERNAIHGPKRAPRTNKKKEHYKTMVGIDFDPDADSSVYSVGSRSIRTSTTVKSYTSNKLLNPEHQLKLYKTRPPYLPSAYSDDREFTCLSCQEIRKWTDGVWRVPMWPSFDVCIACGNKELQTGTSKKELKEFDPMNGNHNNNNNIYSPHDQHNQFGDISAAKHRKVPSTAPIMKEYIENINNNNEYKMTQEALEMLRKQLSSIIEELTDQKLQRLDNLSSWAKIDKEFEEWKAKINAEHMATEDEINSWRKRAKRLDEQDQRVLRRKHTVDIESPTASDLGSDEELHQNWQDYDYKDDFATIHDRIKDLDSLFWTEDEFFKKKFENISISNGNKFKSLQQKYSQTTHELQQRNDELTSKMHTIMSNNNGVGGDNRYNDMDGDGTDSDDLEREDTEKYQKYIPPTVKHIHENSQAIQGINPQQLNAPNRDYENNDDDINHVNDINDRQKVMVLENTLKEYDEKIDHYISTVNRKDRELKELKHQIGYLEQMNETEEEFAALHDELERTKREKADLESKLSTSTLSSYHHISNLDKGSDDSSFNEPIPSEHPSPVLHPSDIDINIDNIRQYENIQYENELENEYKQEEKQSSPTIREKIGINGMNSINTVTSDDTMTTPITPDILYHLTHSLNVNDLPIHINSINEIDNNNLDSNNNKLSELFVGGGKQYWQNIKDSMISNEFYPSNTDAISETDILNEDVEIDISALGLPLNNIPPTNKNKTKNNKYNKLISPVTPVTPQPSQSRMIMKLKLNNKENNKNDSYQNVSSSTNNRQISSSDIDIEPEFDDDELKYTTGSDYTNGTTILSAPTNNASGVIPDNDTEIVPFAIAALFDNITDPNPITSESEMKIKHNEHSEHEHKDEQHKIDEPPSIPPVLVSMQSIHDDNNNLISIDDVYEKISRHASNPEILIPGDTNDRNSQSKITIYTPIMDENNNNQIHEREKSLSPDKNDMNRNTSPSPDDQALKIDYQLETVAKSKIVRRLSFPLGRIDEHPIVPDYINNTSPISPIDDDAPHAFGSLISNDNQNDNQNNEYKQEKDDGDIDIDDDIDDDNDDNDDDDDDELVKRLSTDKESVISDLETDENKDDLQSDHDNDNDSDNEIQIDRDHINDNNEIVNNDNEINDGSGGTGNDFRGKKDRGNHNNQEMYVFDEPVEPVQPIDNADDNSIFDDFAADQKELDAMEQNNNNNINNNNIMDDNAVQLMKDNEIRLKAANVEIDKLQEQIESIKNENNRLAVTKMESLNKLSLQIEEMRDEIQHMCQQLQLKDHTIKKLIHINKEGYDPDMDQKHDFETRKISNSLIGIGGSLGISNSLNGLLTFGRSKYSTCLHTQQTKKSKIDLAIETSKEIHRLREIIRVLSTNKTTNGSNTNKSSKYGLFDGVYPGSK